MFWAYGAGAIFGAADGAEEDCMGGFGGGEGFVGERFAVGVYGALDSGEGMVSVVCFQLGTGMGIGGVMEEMLGW